MLGFIRKIKEFKDITTYYEWLYKHINDFKFSADYNALD